MNKTLTKDQIRIASYAIKERIVLREWIKKFPLVTNIKYTSIFGQDGYDMTLDLMGHTFIIEAKCRKHKSTQLQPLSKESDTLLEEKKYNALEQKRKLYGSASVLYVTYFADNIVSNINLTKIFNNPYKDFDSSMKPKLTQREASACTALGKDKINKQAYMLPLSWGDINAINFPQVTFDKYKDILIKSAEKEQKTIEYDESTWKEIYSQVFGI